MYWLETSNWSLEITITVFLLGAAAIAVTGTYLTGIADRLADRTGLGEALIGAVLLGATTSLSGTTLSVTAAWFGRPELAIGNALGGIAVQTAFLALADMVYRRANLEHAAASAANMMQGALLASLLALVMIAAVTPEITFWSIHPVTPILLITYIYGILFVRSARNYPMWRPEETRETKSDQPEPESERESLSYLLVSFIALALVMGVSGWVLEKAAATLARQTGLTQTVVGVFMTSIATSLPELVTSIAAVRRGALTLAVSGIIGGNAFDTLFAAFSDVAYRGGSVYHAISDRLLFLIALTILMTCILLMGLIRREKQGIGGIGFESFGILVLYLGAILLLTVAF